MDSSYEVVLLTGISGFLGQHVLKLLLTHSSATKIRGIDKRPFKPTVFDLNQFSLESYKDRVEIYCQDLLNIESCREIVKNVDVVLHCAAMVSYEFPADKDALFKNNVSATSNLLQLCIEENVGSFVHCSTTEVTEQCSLLTGMISLIIYRQESQIPIPEDNSRLIFKEYAASKLISEKLVLATNGTPLKNNKGVLHTVSLRPTLLYGEGDKHFIPMILKEAKKNGYYLHKPAGKQQLTYVGNAAWAMICAKDTLRKDPAAISGLPVIITDDTVVEDINRFCEKITRLSNNQRMRFFSWSLPSIVSYFFATFIEIVARFHFIKKLYISPKSLIAYSGSVLLYNRSRASIHMDYAPKFTPEKSFAAASEYYLKLLNDL